MGTRHLYWILTGLSLQCGLWLEHPTKIKPKIVLDAQEFLQIYCGSMHGELGSIRVCILTKI
jgi:hypothetical protein